MFCAVCYPPALTQGFLLIVWSLQCLWSVITVPSLQCPGHERDGFKNSSGCIPVLALGQAPAMTLLQSFILTNVLFQHCSHTDTLCFFPMESLAQDSPQLTAVSFLHIPVSHKNATVEQMLRINFYIYEFGLLRRRTTTKILCSSLVFNEGKEVQPIPPKKKIVKITRSESKLENLQSNSSSSKALYSLAFTLPRTSPEYQLLIKAMGSFVQALPTIKPMLDNYQSSESSVVLPDSTCVQSLLMAESKLRIKPGPLSEAKMSSQGLLRPHVKFENVTDQKRLGKIQGRAEERFTLGLKTYLREHKALAARRLAVDRKFHHAISHQAQKHFNRAAAILTCQWILQGGHCVHEAEKPYQLVHPGGCRMLLGQGEAKLKFFPGCSVRRSLSALATIPYHLVLPVTPVEQKKFIRLSHSHLQSNPAPARLFQDVGSGWTSQQLKQSCSNEAWIWQVTSLRKMNSVLCEGSGAEVLRLQPV
ncbi:hypothetical protein Q9966_003253 [Columba livia]|nr:hypothetical protein Q9966_003253 [Columba livia]